MFTNSKQNIVRIMSKLIHLGKKKKKKSTVKLSDLSEPKKSEIITLTYSLITWMFWLKE